MLACLDVDYRNDCGFAAVVLFEEWTSSDAAATHVEVVNNPADYEPGSFYKRELPCLMSALKSLSMAPDMILIDGYVWLEETDNMRKPGLGARLHEALSGSCPIIGVAKTVFKSSPSIEVLRGTSTRPLYVTAAGINEIEAAQHIKDMHGSHRIPTMLKLADSLARGHTV